MTALHPNVALPDMHRLLVTDRLTKRIEQGRSCSRE